MEIDKKKISANWYNFSTRLDDIAYVLYIKKCDELSLTEGYQLTLMDQVTFITLGRERRWVDECYKHYDDAEIILRDEKIKKILDATNK